LDDPYLFIAVVSLVLGLVSGYLMHRSDFCVTGMFRDYFLFRHTFMLRILLLLIVVSAASFEAARWLGLLVDYPFPLLGPPAATNVLGGVLFGIGMVLAGGCVVGTLYKMGAGSVLSLVAFVGLVVGATLYAEIHPWWSAISKAAVLTPGKVTLPQILGVEPQWLLLPMLAVSAFLLYRWYGENRWHQEAVAEGYIQPWKVAVALAALGLISYLLEGMPLGITTSYSKFGATIENLFAPEHVAGLAYFQAVPLNYTPPLSATPIQGGAGPALDAIAAIQYPLIFGIVLGAALSALLLKEFKLHTRAPARQYASVLLGGIVLGLAARMTPACNVWHLFGGVPILAGQSLLFLVGLFPGAWIGSRILARWIIR
jgi:uncharacterized membrane protein YedE/YeeE